jgi:hypothetical protein
MSIFLGLGVLGNLINIYMFTQKNSRRNSCSLYLLAASAVNLFNVIWGIAPTLYTLENTDPSTYSYIYCKLRMYIGHTCLMIGRSLIVFACIDRYALCSQSVRLRSFCQPKVAIRIIIAHFLIWPILTIHIVILENFSGNSCSMIGAYILIYAIYSSMVAGTIPPLSMAILSILTIRHRRELRTRLSTGGNNSKRDHSLLVMLSSEVIVYVVTTILYPTNTLYRAITNDEVKSIERQQIEAFVNFIAGSFLIYLNPAAVFYVYFIGSKNFRKECMMPIKKLIRKIMRRPTQVEPWGTHSHNTLQHTTHI